MTDEALGDRAIQKLRQLIAEKVRKARPGSPEEYRLRETLELSDDALIDQLYAHVQPNPDRVGCPPRAILIELAQRTRPLTDPWWDHILTCSPCRVDVRELRRRLPPAPVRSPWSRLWGWVTEWFSRGPVARTGDLRQYRVTHDQPQPREPALELPQQQVRLTLVLPDGSEAGRYDLQVREADGRLRATAVGEATRRDVVTSLDADLDLRSVPSGRYTLALRPAGEEWQLVPVRIE